MKDFERFILDNLNILILMAFVFAPMILKALANKRQKSTGRKPPTAAVGPEAKTGAPKATGANLEQKIRRFFEDLSEDKGHFPKPQQPPESQIDAENLPSPPPDPRFQAGPAPEFGTTGLEAVVPEIVAEAGVMSRPDRAARPSAAPADPQVPASLMTVSMELDDSAYNVDRSQHEPPPVEIPWEHKKKKRSAYHFSKSELSGTDLRKAIVFKEILDKPVSLRD